MSSEVLTQTEDIENGESSMYLTFYQGDEIYGFKIDSVKEVIEKVNVTRIPLVPKYIRGVMNLRGNVVPVIDLSYLFYKREINVGKFTSIIILEIPDQNELVPMGIMTDQINEVVDIHESQIGERPDFGTRISASYINGIGKVNDKFVILLDEKEVLDVGKLSSFDHFIAESDI